MINATQENYAKKKDIYKLNIDKEDVIVLEESNCIAFFKDNNIKVLVVPDGDIDKLGVIRKADQNVLKKIVNRYK